MSYLAARPGAEVIRASDAVATPAVDLTALEKLVLTAAAYFQPVTLFSAETSAATFRQRAK